MKTLQQHLNESINESMRGFYATVYGDPYSGPLQITKGPNPESEDMDWLGDEISKGTGNVACVSWCDDTIYGYVLNSVHDEKDYRKQLLDSVKKNWEDAKEYGEITVEIGGDERTYGFDEANNSTPEEYVKSFIDSINQSEVDGDSGYCTVVVDLKKKVVIAGGRAVQFNY